MDMQLTAMLTHFLLVSLMYLNFSWSHISHLPLPTISLQFLERKNHLYPLLWQLVLFKMVWGLDLCTKEWYQFPPELIALSFSPLLRKHKSSLNTEYTGQACIQSSRENGLSARLYSIRYTNPGSTGSMFSAANIQKLRETDRHWLITYGTRI